MAKFITRDLKSHHSGLDEPQIGPQHSFNETDDHGFCLCHQIGRIPQAGAKALGLRIAVLKPVVPDPALVIVLDEPNDTGNPLDEDEDEIAYHKIRCFDPAQTFASHLRSFSDCDASSPAHRAVTSGLSLLDWLSMVLRCYS
jgi:hypothetical protein